MGLSKEWAEFVLAKAAQGMGALSEGTKADLAEQGYDVDNPGENTDDDGNKLADKIITPGWWPDKNTGDDTGVA